MDEVPQIQRMRYVQNPISRIYIPYPFSIGIPTALSPQSRSNNASWTDGQNRRKSSTRCRRPEDNLERDPATELALVWTHVTLHFAWSQVLDLYQALVPHYAFLGIQYLLSCLAINFATLSCLPWSHGYGVC